MERVKIDLEHCYGIKKLKHVFDFSQRRVYDHVSSVVSVSFD
jgi:hypothetical protein